MLAAVIELSCASTRVLPDAPLERLPGLTVHGVVTDGEVAIPLDDWHIRGRAVLVRARGTRLSPAAVELLVHGPAAAVGLEFEDAPTQLLEAGVPIVSMLRGVDRLPRTGFWFSAVSHRDGRVRAFAELVD